LPRLLGAGGSSLRRVALFEQHEQGIGEIARIVRAGMRARGPPVSNLGCLGPLSVVFAGCDGALIMTMKNMSIPAVAIGLFIEVKA